MTDWRDVKMAGTGLQISDVSHSYEGKPVLYEWSSDVPAGKVVALLGPSGCGKSTILRAIAGLIVPDQGKHPPERPGPDPGAGAQPQARHGLPELALFSHLTVAENIAYGLGCLPRAGPDGRVERMLDLVRLRASPHRLPPSLSGGQQQRVAVARALAPSRRRS